MRQVHHAAICVQDVDASIRFWRQGLGFTVLMDEQFTGDWPTLLRASSTSLRAVFLGNPASPDAGIVELVDLGATSQGRGTRGSAEAGFLLLSVMTDVAAALERLASLGLGGEPRRVRVAGVEMAVVQDPDGVLIELVDAGASANLDRLGVGQA